ncbi:glycosyltransferase [Paenibacillus alkalitolerans]|uniref:glycosyltransferase n=1 Tax=Paenibacillus alkalitolerans TaxID=2799335 RepID=UPI0018F3F1EA|nr:glycosyltransferase [Paenibacillus alkalitolerans]
MHRIIAYYISDYGYGHASRSIAVIRQLLKQPWVSKLYICTSFPMQFIMNSLDGYKEKLHFRHVKNDIGYVLQEESTEIDTIRLNLEFDRFVDSFPEALHQEQWFMQEKKVDMVIADIPPIPLLAARTLGIPSIGISNFTWYTAYRRLIPNNKLHILAECYQAMDYFAALSGANEPVWSRYIGKFDFFCRQTDRLEVQRLRRWIDPDGEKKIVYFGLGMKVDIASLSSLKLWDNANCAFIVSSNVHVDRPNVFRIPENYVETQNVIAASDAVISKAGWGTVSEAVVNNKPLILLDRRHLNEDNNTLQYLEKHNRCDILTWRQISELCIDNVLFDRLSLQIKKKADHVNDDKEIFRLIETFRSLLKFDTALIT